MFQHDVILAMTSYVNHQARDNFIEVATFPASALYDDWQGNHFRANWTYRFYPHVYRGHEMRRENRTEGIVPETLGPYLVVSSVATERI